MNRLKPNSRQQAERHGRLAELLASCLLRLKLYRILAHRFRSRSGEVDIIAQTNNVVILVEVKARASHEAALESVTWTSRRRIEATGQDFLTRHAKLMQLGLRYDIITLSGWRLSHIRDAWRSGE